MHFKIQAILIFPELVTNLINKTKFLYRKKLFFAWAASNTGFELKCHSARKLPSTSSTTVISGSLRYNVYTEGC